MRSKPFAAIVAIALAIAVSVIGQQDPLPVVSARSNAEIPLAEPTVVLAVEPLHEYQAPTLLEAARRNDFVSFDALYTAARTRGADVSQYATLHELWTYSVTDPIGAFYGRDLYEKLSRAYPGYAAYIADFRIVDDRGNVFYPTSETRKFLLDRVNERKAPRVQIAESKPAPAPHRGVQASWPASKPTPTPKPEAGQEAYTPPVAVAAQPVQQPVQQSVPQPLPQPTQQLQQPPATQQPTQQPTTQPTSGRGILLLIIGLIGIGLLAVILRTPREVPIQIVQTPQQPPANVEPLRKTSTPAPPPGDHRAAG